MKSIISNEKKCFICNTTLNLHKHHIYGGSNRNISEREGFWVFLCAIHHNMSPNSVHLNEKLNKKLKRFCQIKYETKHSRDEFIKLIGRSYL